MKAYAEFHAKRTQRLELRPYGAGDFAAWRSARRDALPAKNTWDSGPVPASKLIRETFSEVLANQRRSREIGEALVLGAFHRKTGGLLGTAIFENAVLGKFQSVNIGYDVVNNFWGQGYGTEIVTALIQIAFKDLDLHRVEALINPKNRRSIQLVRRVGMRREGISRRRAKSDGPDWHDMAVYAITREDFAAARRKK